MSSAVVLSTKGGAAKSTTAINLAITALRQGRSPLVIDCDQAQTSLHVWASAMRRDKPPPVRTATRETIERQLREAEDEGFDLTIVDVPAGGGQLVTRVASLVDHVLVPVKATTFDLSAMRNTVDLLRTTVDDTEPHEIAYRNALGKTSIVLTAVPTRVNDTWLADVKGALAQCGAGGLGIIGMLSDRTVYRTSLEHGRGVSEDRDGKASEEMLDLYRNLVALERRRANAVRKARVRK